jgi:hypothetical protein
VIPAHVRGWATRILVVLIVATGAYGFLRFDTVRLPGDGCSPVHGIDPGARLLLDAWARSPAIGDVVLYRDEAGTLLLGRVRPRPDGTADPAPGEASFWVLGERESCPSPDSRQLGPIAASRLSGRVVYVHP